MSEIKAKAKAKAQLRAEAVERLKMLDDNTVYYEQIADAVANNFACTSSYKLKKVLIDLLTDDEPQEQDSREKIVSDVDLIRLPNGDVKAVLEEVEPQDEQDTREKLEADVREWCESSGAVFPQARANTVVEWLDRQAAITERDVLGREWNYKDTCDSLQEQVDEYAEKVDELEADRRNWQDGYYLAKLTELEAERDELQERVDNLCASEEIGNKLIMVQLETEAEQGRTIVEYAERMGELEAENEKLKEELRLINTYSGVKGCECETTVFGMRLDEVRNLQVENEKLRENLSKALDHAHAIGKLGEI